MITTIPSSKTLSGGEFALAVPQIDMPDDESELIPDPMLRAGTWSNRTRVTLGREELTVDLAVLDPTEPRATIVARVALPIGAAIELRDALDDALGKYTERGRPE